MRTAPRRSARRLVLAVGAVAATAATMTLVATAAQGAQSTLVDETFGADAANFAATGGAWSVSNGIYRLREPGQAERGNANTAVHSHPVTGDFALTVDATVIATQSQWNDFSVLFGYQDAGNYAFVSFNESVDDWTNGVFSVTDGTQTRLAGFTSTITAGQRYRVEVARSGSSITVSLDGSRVGSADVPGYLTGKVGLGSRNDSADFDNLLVTATAADPTPSTTPTATVSPTQPPAGYPTADTTGWRHTGVTLTPYEGERYITEPGTVIDGQDIEDCIVVEAPDVTITRSRIRCESYYPLRVVDGGSLLVEDTEIDGLGFTDAICIASGNYTAVRVDCHGVGDGFRVGDNTVVTDSFAHALVTCDGCHNDAVQATGGAHIVLRHNTLENPYSQTSCIMLGNEFGPLTDVLVQDNLLNGGGYTVYGGGSDSDVDNIRILGNRFQRAPAGFWPDGGYYGPVAHYDPTRPGNQWSGNVWDDNGAAINP
jgi:hypothetical protein